MQLSPPQPPPTVPHHSVIAPSCSCKLYVFGRNDFYSAWEWNWPQIRFLCSNRLVKTVGLSSCKTTMRWKTHLLNMLNYTICKVYFYKDKYNLIASNCPLCCNHSILAHFANPYPSLEQVGSRILHGGLGAFAPGALQQCTWDWTSNPFITRL